MRFVDDQRGHPTFADDLAPGTIGTEGVQANEFDEMGIDAERAAEIADQVGPMRRMGKADEMAAIILFLCSPAARFVNGADLVADGGEMRANWFSFFERGDL